MFQKLELIFEKIEKIFLRVGCFVVFFMMVLLCGEVLSRYVFKMPIPAYYEVLQEILMPYAVFLTITYVYTSGHHIRITMLSKKFPPKANKIIMAIVDAMGAIVLTLVAYLSLMRSIRSYNMQEFASNIYGYPMWIAYVIVVIGLVPLIFQLIRSIIKMEHPGE